MPTIIGTSGNDELVSNAGFDDMQGLAGDDLYIIYSGNDHPSAEITDADGFDTIEFRSNAASTLTLYAGDTGIERIRIGPGTLYDDGVNIDAHLVGNALDIGGGAGANTLIRTAFNDTIDGRADPDRITGGPGNDVLTGGAGYDTFADTAAGLNGDTITDFGFYESIIIIDATLAGFTFSISGSTLTYTGGSLTLGAPVYGEIVAHAAAGGGVELTIGPAVIPAWPAPPAPPNTTAPIEAPGSYSIGSGEYRYMSTEFYHELFSVRPDTLTNSGTIYMDDVAGFYGDMRLAYGHVPHFHNSGTVVVHAHTDIAGNVIAFQDNGSDGLGTEITNFGQIFVISDHFGATFLLSWSTNTTVENSGLIAAFAPEGSAATIELINDGHITNLAGGEILAEAQSASGILAVFDLDLNNAGLIAARSLSGSPSVAVFAEVGTITNSGTISGDISVYIDGTLTNSGTLNGVVLADSLLTFNNQATGVLNGNLIGGDTDDFLFHDIVTNAGLINGNVALFAGNDEFTNTDTGLVAGYVDLGDGNDQFSGGSYFDEVYGGAGNDIIDGGGGYDWLDGEAGADTLTGGAGIDILTGGSGNDSFKDTKAGLSGDRITDFAAGDTIIFTDATLAGFAFSLEGHTLTFIGGSLALTNVPTGTIVASAAAGGGVQLTISPAAAHAPNNDFNGDGKSDLLWRSDLGQVSNWLGEANGGFANNDVNALTKVATNWHVVGTGDFNGDGREDILWRSDVGQLSDWLGQANGGFVSNDANAFINVPTNWQVVGTGDFNGDGRDDILWRSDVGQLSDWLGQANGGFVTNDANAFTNVPTHWHVVGAGDFNGDGRDDVLWRSDAGQLSDWLGQANGGFVTNDANAFTNVSTHWHVVGAGDFNGDGRDDVLWRSDAGQLSNWLGQANGGFVTNDANAFTAVQTNWHVVAVGDYNGDGRDDILWRNGVGQLSDWLGQASGGFANNDANAFNSVPTSWQIDPESFWL